MSVQVGRGMNSIPKHIISDEEWENGKRYVCVECGVLNAEEEALKPYAEDSENLLETIYAYVPGRDFDIPKYLAEKGLDVNVEYVPNGMDNGMLAIEVFETKEIKKENDNEKRMERKW